MQKALLILLFLIVFGRGVLAQSGSFLRGGVIPLFEPPSASSDQIGYPPDPLNRFQGLSWAQTQQPYNSNATPELLPVPSGGATASPSQVESLFPALDSELVNENEPLGQDVAEASRSGDYGDSGYGGDLQWGFWGWFSYLRVPQLDQSTFVAYEFELAVTKGITQQIAATAEIDFMDIPDNEVFTEQLFLSIVLPNHQETILTVGKFNSPFGVEPRDFWNRVSASRSLLLRRQPRDLIGAMITHPVVDTNLILRPMLISGLVNKGFDNNEQPSLAVMAEYRLNDNFSVAGTYWNGPELDQEVGDKLSFIDVQTTLFLTEYFSLSGEYYSGATESGSGSLDWQSFLALANWDLCEKCRLFAQYSLFNDRDGFLTGIAEKRKEVNVGFGWYLHPMAEVRSEYRHDFQPLTGDLDHWDTHITFGF